MEKARRKTKDRQVDGSTGILTQAAGSQSPLFLFGCFTSSEEMKAQEVKSHPEIQLVSREASMPNEVYWKHRPKVSYHMITLLFKRPDLLFSWNQKEQNQLNEIPVGLQQHFTANLQWTLKACLYLDQGR